MKKVFQSYLGTSRGNTVIHSELREGQEGSACFDVSPHSTHNFITADHWTLSHMHRKKYLENTQAVQWMHNETNAVFFIR